MGESGGGGQSTKHTHTHRQAERKRERDSREKRYIRKQARLLLCLTVSPLPLAAKQPLVYAGGKGGGRAQSPTFRLPHVHAFRRLLFPILSALRYLANSEARKGDRFTDYFGAELGACVVTDSLFLPFPAKNVK